MQNLMQWFWTLGLTLFFAAGNVAFAQDEEKEKVIPIKPAEVKLGRPVEFEKDILPFLDDSCISCHNVVVDEGELVLEDVPAMLKGGKHGTSLVAGQPDKSPLYVAAARLAAKTAMPPMPNDAEAEVLTPQQLGLLRQWIVEGAKAGAGSAERKIAWRPVPQQANAVYSVALSPWAQFVAAGRANQVVLFDITGKQEIGRLIDPGLSTIKWNDGLMYPDGAAHRDFVHSVAFSPDGNWIASGGFRTLKLWQKQPQQQQQLALAADVTALAVTADGKSAATALADNTIQLWNLATGKPAALLKGHAAPIRGLAFTADGAKLVSGSADKTIRLWNVAAAKQEGQLTAPADVRALLLSKDGSQVVSGDADNTIRVWALPQPGNNDAAAPVAELKGHSKPVTALALILPAGKQIASGSEDGTLRTWDLASKRNLKTMNLGAPITDVAVRPDGAAVAASATNNIARIYDLNGKQLAELKGDVNLTRNVVSKTDGQTVAKQQFALADAAVKAAEKNLKDRQDASKKAGEAKTAADKALTEAQKKAKEANDKVNAAKAELDKKPDDAALKKKHDAAVKAAAKPNDELKKAQSGKTSAERAIKLAAESIKTAQANLDTRNKAKAAADAAQKKADADLAAAKTQEQAGLKPIRTIAFSSDAKRIVTGGDDNLAHVWDAATGQAIDALSGHGAPLTALAAAPGARVVSAGADKTLRIWSVNPTWTLAGRIGAQDNDPDSLAASPFISRIVSLAFSPDGKLLATGGGDPSRNGELMIWNVQDRKLVRTIADAHSDVVLDVEFSRDGKSLLSGGADKFMRLFDVATGKLDKAFEGHTHHVLGVAWKADGSAVASAGADNVIKIWNVETGEQKRTIANYTKQVTGIQYIGTGDNMVSSGGDKTVRLHTASNGRNYRSFSGAADFVYSAAASRDEKIVVAGGEDGVVRVWNGTNGSSIFNFEPPKPAANAQASAAK